MIYTIKRKESSSKFDAYQSRLGKVIPSVKYEKARSGCRIDVDQNVGGAAKPMAGATNVQWAGTAPQTPNPQQTMAAMHGGMGGAPGANKKMFLKVSANKKRSPSPAFLLSFLGVCIWGMIREVHWDYRALSFSPPAGVVPPLLSFDYEPVGVHSPSAHANVTVSICLVVRNETVYLDEWADFHVSLGFGPIYIYDNADAPDLELEAWHARRADINHLVHIRHMPMAPVHGLALARCLQEDGPDATFAALIDVDEFVVLKRHDNVVDFMVDRCDEDCGQLSLNWRTMGTSGEAAYRPLPVTRRNVHVHTYRPLEKIVKAIVRPSYAADYIDWSHTVALKRGQWVDTDGTVVPRWPSTTAGRVPYVHRGPTDAAALYHYRFKSEEEFYAKSCVRGEAIRSRGVTPKCGHMDRPQNYPRDGGEFDDLAWRQLVRRVPKYAIFDKMANSTL